MSTATTHSESRSAAASPSESSRAGRPRTMLLAMAGGILLWASFPRVDLWPLAWLAPVPWIWLAMTPTLSGRRPYLTIYLAGLAYWLAVLYFLTLPYWASAFGWLALAGYAAIYLPLFVGLTRVAVHQWRLPVIIAAPAVWTGLELARAYVLGGFSMANLAHSQYRWLTMIQISDLAGAYGLSFLMVLVSACLARAYLPGGRLTLWPLIVGVAALGGALAYGQTRIAGDHSSPGPKVALIQGSIDVDFNPPPNRNEQMFGQYLSLSQEALARDPQVDLIVWPESMYSYPLFLAEPGATKPPEVTVDIDELVSVSRHGVNRTARDLGVPWMFGVDTVTFTPRGAQTRNAAMAVDTSGQVLGSYVKCHLVMFGEYIPFGEVFPWLYKFSPLAMGLSTGDGPASIKIGAYRYSPTICYETIVPHLVRRQVKELRDRGEEPDVLVNLTNDGWFWGSSELDLHLACGVFRAVECRKPLVIAANTGFSASIGADGAILERGPRRATGGLIAQVALDNRASPYVEHGDLLAGASLAVCLSLAVAGAWRRMRRSAASPA